MTELSLARFRCCTKCGCTKPATLDYFRHSGWRKDGTRRYRSECIVCGRLQDEQHRNKPEYKQRKKTYNKAYYDADRENQIARAGEWAKRNPEKVRAKGQRQYAAMTPGQKAAKSTYWQKWYEAKKLDPEWLEGERQRKRRVQHDRRVNGGPERGYDQRIIQQMYDDQDGLCAYCEIPLFGTFEVEHMLPLSRRGSNEWDNLAITCPSCNRKKRTKTVEEFFNSL